MENLVEDGSVKHHDVSNFSVQQVEELLTHVSFLMVVIIYMTDEAA